MGQMLQEDVPEYPRGQKVVIGDRDGFKEEETDTVEEESLDTVRVMVVVEDTERLREVVPDLVDDCTGDDEARREGDALADLDTAASEKGIIKLTTRKRRSREGLAAMLLLRKRPVNTVLAKSKAQKGLG